MQAGYLGGVWAAVKLGLGAGTSALIVGLQPVLTALWLTRTAKSRGAGAVSARQWLGLVLGFAGIALVVWRKLGGEVTPANLALATTALLSITTGTLRALVAPYDVRTASAVQMLSAFVVCLPIALLEPGADGLALEPDRGDGVVGRRLTLGGSSLLYLLIQRGEATAVTSLLPPRALHRNDGVGKPANRSPPP
jgi:drug/metabolite transporter (DMT)-like permease